MIKINFQTPPEGSPANCYHTVMKSCLEHAGLCVPRWLIVSVAGVSRFNYFHQVDDQGQTQFAGVSFTDAPEILESTAAVPGLFGVSSEVVYGLSWEQTMDRIKAGVDRDLGVMAGPFDSHYMRMFNETHLDVFQPETGHTDHFFAITGYDDGGIYFSDNVGYCHVHMPWDNLRSGLTSSLYFYSAGREEGAERDCLCRLVLFGCKERSVSTNELLRLAVNRIRSQFLAGDDFIDGKTEFVYGSRGLLRFADACQEAFGAPDVKTLRTIVTELYRSRTGTMWGHQLRSWYAYFWHRVAIEGSTDVEATVAGELAELFFEASQAWVDQHRWLRKGFEALYDKGPLAAFSALGPELARRVRRIAKAEAAAARILAPDDRR